MKSGLLENDGLGFDGLSGIGHVVSLLLLLQPLCKY